MFPTQIHIDGPTEVLLSDDGSQQQQQQQRRQQGLSFFLRYVFIDCYFFFFLLAYLPSIDNKKKFFALEFIHGHSMADDNMFTVDWINFFCTGCWKSK